MKNNETTGWISRGCLHLCKSRELQYDSRLGEEPGKLAIQNQLRMGKCDWKWSKWGGFHETDGSEDGTKGSRTSLQEVCRRFCHFKSWVCNAQLSKRHPRVTPAVDWISRICGISIKLVAFGILMRNYFVPDLVMPKIHICPHGSKHDYIGIRDPYIGHSNFPLMVVWSSPKKGISVYHGTESNSWL